MHTAHQSCDQAEDNDAYNRYLPINLWVNSMSKSNASKAVCNHVAETCKHNYFPVLLEKGHIRKDDVEQSAEEWKSVQQGQLES